MSRGLSYQGVSPFPVRFPASCCGSSGVAVMAHPNGPTVVDLVRRSELIEPDDLELALAECQRSHGGKVPAEGQEVLRYLQNADLLTSWQCEQFAAGKAKGFFLSKYKILAHIGTGGMSSVYLAEHQLMRQRRAVKVLPRHLVEEATYLTRFYREAEAIAKLDHPNIVQAYDVDHDGDLHYLVMEYVPGENLQAVVKRNGPVDFPDAARYTLAACDALEYAHQAGVVHRDIKPSNLLLDESGVVKLLDLGLARFSDESGDTSLTNAGQGAVMGTADYLAPEQAIDSHAAGPPADLYGLGCTLYFLLTGHAPFTEGSVTQRILNHLNLMPAEIQQDRPDCPRSLSDICWRMIQKRPQDRYPSAAAAGAALRGWLRGSSNPVDMPGPAAAARQIAQRIGSAAAPPLVAGPAGSMKQPPSSQYSATNAATSDESGVSSLRNQRRVRLRSGKRLLRVSWFAAGLVLVVLLLAMWMKTTSERPEKKGGTSPPAKQRRRPNERPARSNAQSPAFSSPRVPLAGSARLTADGYLAAHLAGVTSSTPASSGRRDTLAACRGVA